MSPTSTINSETYWNSRFSSDWESCDGPRQSRFFAQLAINHLPRWLIEQIRRQSLTLADWGCAQGDGTDVWLGYIDSKQLVGVDFSSVAIEQATQRYPTIRFISEDWLMESKSSIEVFDVVFSSNTLEHFYKPYDTLQMLCKRAKKAIILALPYREMSRIEEHLFSFLPNNITLLLPNGFRLVWSKVVDCRHLSDGLWGGDQIFLVYADAEWVDSFRLTLSDVTITHDDTALELKAVSTVLAKQDELIAGLNKALTERDGHVQELGREVVRLDAHAQELGREVVRLDAHAQVLAKEVIEKDRHAQELARELRRLNERMQIECNKTLWQRIVEKVKRQ